MHSSQRFYSLILVLMFSLLLSGCTGNYSELESQALTFYEEENYPELAKVYQKMKKSDKEQAANFLETIKSEYKLDNISMNMDVKGKIEKLVALGNNISELKEYADTQSVLIENYIVVTSAVNYINGRHTNSIEEYEKPLVLMRETDEVQSLINKIESTSKELNKHIIELDSLSNVENDVASLLDAMKKHKSDIDAKIVYLSENIVNIAVANSTLAEGSFIGMSNYNDYSDDLKFIDANIKSTLTDLQQRASKFK